ncbi:probable uridine nucleosidase 1 [Trichonephila clavipes]|nr:probable uridine nucleosidase 1 [Trichonephila clavipes]
MGSPVKLIVDTDCGVDDAMAIMLALSSSARAEVIGVTCVHGTTILDNVCNNVKRVLVACDKKGVPVYKGSVGPLIVKNFDKDPVYHGGDGLGNVAHQFSTGDLVESETSAVMALIQLTKEHPGEIMLIALGPLTNLALAHRIDPKFTERLKSLVIMGGNYKGFGNVTVTAEFNFYNDPEAADIVLGESLCPTTLVPWETCLEHPFTFETYARLIQVPTTKGRFYSSISNMMIPRAKARGRTFCTDCDLLAVAAALYPESIKTTLESPLAVECGGTYCRGLTLLLNHYRTPDHGRKNVRIVTEFKVDVLDQLRYKMLQDSPITL